MPTEQETFDTVVRHLLTQRRQSYDAESHVCVYKHQDGSKCAAGILIPDELYREALEGQSIYTSDYLSSAGVVIRNLGHNPELVQALQHIHDNEHPTSWFHSLKSLGATRGLNLDVFLEFAQW